MDQNLIMDFETQHKMQEEEREKDKRKNGWLFKKLGLASLLYTFIFTVCLYKNTDGILAIFWVAVTLAYACYAISITGKCVKKESKFLLVIIGLLGICNFTTANQWVLWMNYSAMFVLLICFLLKNIKAEQDWELENYVSEGALAIVGAIAELDKPFVGMNAYLKNRKKGERGKLGYIAIGIGIAIPGIIFLGMLLMSADMVFASMIKNIFSGFHFKFNHIGIIWMLLFGFFSSYCGIYYFTKEKAIKKRKEKHQGEPILAITITVCIAMLYVLFSFIQIMYLFIGNLELPDGMTYAQYARSGFFQLLLVCALNLLLVLGMEKRFQKHRLLDAMLLMICACTFVMIASSTLRMLLYIKVYHLTFLRIAVLFALFTITLLMAGVVFYILSPKFLLFRYGICVVSVCYLAFAFLHADYLIAAYNLSYMEKPNYDECEYLTRLSADAAPAIAAYIDKMPQNDRVEIPGGDFAWKDGYLYQSGIKERKSTWRNYNFSYSLAKKKLPVSASEADR